VLVPDLVINHGDTIIQNCTYLDVISATDSLIMVRNPSPFSYIDKKHNLDIEVRKVSR
jgi:MinD superfamily P-loop ATPase